MPARRVQAWVLAVSLAIIGVIAPIGPASSTAPLPLPQSSTPQTFAAGSYIIDSGFMGISTTAQPKPEGLQPYGLIYQLLVTKQIPVYWIVGNGKQGQVQSAPSLTNLAPDFTTTVRTPYTAASVTSKSYYSGAFVVPDGFITDAELTSLLAVAALTNVRVDKATVDFTAPVFDKIGYWPKATLDAQNGSIAQGFYTNAKIPASTASYNWKAPSQLTSCDDVFVMPHADPTWATHQRLLSWNLDSKGYIWAGCHAVSVLENIKDPASPTVPAMNFLSTEGLLLYGSHADGSVPYYYGVDQSVTPATPGTTTADRSDPIMQFLGATELAHQNGSEQIYMPNPETAYPSLTGVSRWRPGVRFVSWDPTQADVVAGKSAGVAAADVYGRGFDDPNRGLVMYQGGHSLNKGTVGDTPSQRAFFNFLLLSGIEKAPRPAMSTTVSGPLQSGGTRVFTTTLSGGSPAYSYSWQSTCGGTFSQASGTTGPGTISTTFTAPTVNGATPCQVKLVLTDSCGRQAFDAMAVQVVPVADVRIAKTASAVVGLNGTIQYTLTVANDGPGPAENVVVTDTLPAGVTYNTGSASPAPATVAGQVLTWNLGTLAKGATQTITLTAKANQGGVTVLNVASVSSSTPDPNLTNNTAKAPTKIVNSGVEITKVARPEIVPGAGGAVTYEYTVRNTGDNPLSNIVITDNPACTAMSGPTGDLNGDGLLNEPYLGVDREIWRYSCTRTVNSATPDADKAAGETTIAHALDTDPNTKQNVVRVNATDAAGFPLTARAWATVTLSTPAIAITKTLEPAGQTPAPGDKATFRVVVSNTGNVTLSSVDTADIWAGTCDTTVIPSLAKGTSFSMLCDATTPAAPTAMDDFATASTSGGSGWVTNWSDNDNPVNNMSNGTVKVVDGAATGLPAGYSTPNVVSYTGNKVTLDRQVNLSGKTSAVLRFAYNRSADFNNGGRNFNVYASANGTTWVSVGSITPITPAAAVPDGGWTWFEAAIPVATFGANTRIRFGDPAIDLTGRTIFFDDVTVLGSQLNSVTATGKDPFGTTVTATATAPVQPGLPKLGITKTASTAGPVKVGDTFTYTVTVSNTDTSSQTGLVVTDTLPTGLALDGTVTAAKPAYSMSATDGFGTGGASYATGSGWTTGWTETGEATDPTGGKVKIVTNKGNPVNSLYFNPDNKLYTIQRTVNLGGLTSAALSFQCSRDAFTAAAGTNNDALVVKVGTQTVATIDSTTAAAACPTDKGTTWGTVTTAISLSQLVDGAVLSFEITGDKEAWVDNVSISGSAPAANVTAGNPPTLTAAGGPYNLNAGTHVTFTIPVKVTAAPADGYEFSNLATASSAQRPNPVSASVVTPYRAADFAITKAAIETWVNGSGTVTYRIELRNTGNSDLTPGTVSDPTCGSPLSGPVGDLNSDGKLQVGEIWRYTCTRVVTTPSSPPDPDVVPNIATATLKDGWGGDVGPKTANAAVRVVHPSIDLQVTPLATTVLTGSTVAYTYTLTNTGDVGITAPAVVAANCSPVVYGSGDTNNDGMLDVGEVWTYTCTTDALTADQTMQAVTATGKDLIFASPVTDTEHVSVDVINPAIAVDKKVRDTLVAGSPVDGPLDVGSVNSIAYTYDVSNTGDVPLQLGKTSGDQYLPTDDACSPLVYASGDLNSNNLLDVGEVWHYTCTAGQTPPGVGTVTGTVVATGFYSVGGLTGTVSGTDKTVVHVLFPELLLLKNPSMEFVALGATVAYHYTVRNTGQTSFALSKLGAPSDDKCSPLVAVPFAGTSLDANANGVLDPGEELYYACSSVMVALPGGQTTYVHDNTFTLGSSTDNRGAPFTPAPAVAGVYVLNPSFTLEKLATSGTTTGNDIIGVAGEPVTYTFKVAHSLTTPTGDFLDSLNALSLDVQDPKCDAPSTT